MTQHTTFQPPALVCITSATGGVGVSTLAILLQDYLLCTGIRSEIIHYAYHAVEWDLLMGQDTEPRYFSPFRELVSFEQCRSETELIIVDCERAYLEQMLVHWSDFSQGYGFGPGLGVAEPESVEAVLPREILCVAEVSFAGLDAAREFSYSLQQRLGIHSPIECRVILGAVEREILRTEEIQQILRMPVLAQLPYIDSHTLCAGTLNPRVDPWKSWLALVWKLIQTRTNILPRQDTWQHVQAGTRSGARA